MAEKFANLNLKNTGSTVVFTPPFSGGVSYFLRSLFVECTEATNIAVPASISMGTNSPNYDNILPISLLTGLTSAGLAIRIPATLEVPVSKDTPIRINVTTAATGTSQTVDLFLDGFYGA